MDLLVESFALHVWVDKREDIFTDAYVLDLNELLKDNIHNFFEEDFHISLENLYEVLTLKYDLNLSSCNLTQSSNIFISMDRHIDI